MIIPIIALVVVLAYYTLPIARSLVISKKIISETKPYTQLNEVAKYKILIAGDSTVFGVGASDPRNSITGRFGQDYPESEIINLSVPGLTTAQLKRKLEKHLQKRTYDYIHIQIGANDIISLSKYGQLEDDLRSILDLISNKSQYATVLTAADVGKAPVFKYPLSKYITDRTLAVRQIFIETITEYPAVQYVDLYSRKKMNQKFTESPTKFYARDAFHPSDIGYGEWYKAIIEELNK